MTEDKPFVYDSPLGTQLTVAQSEDANAPEQLDVLVEDCRAFLTAEAAVALIAYLATWVGDRELDPAKLAALVSPEQAMAVHAATGLELPLDEGLAPGECPECAVGNHGKALIAQPDGTTVCNCCAAVVASIFDNETEGA